MVIGMEKRISRVIMAVAPLLEGSVPFYRIGPWPSSELAAGGAFSGRFRV